LKLGEPDPELPPGLPCRNITRTPSAIGPFECNGNGNHRFEAAEACSRSGRSLPSFSDPCCPAIFPIFNRQNIEDSVTGEVDFIQH
jgi:hypothetical protein